MWIYIEIFMRHASVILFRLEEWEAAGEYPRARIAKHLQQHGNIMAEDIEYYAASYEKALEVVALRRWDRISWPLYPRKSLFLNIDETQNGKVILSHLLN